MLRIPKSPQRRNNGFTLAEMTIVIIVLAILSTVSYRTYFTERDRFQFNNSLTKILQIIQTARSHAISSQPVFVPTPAPGKMTVASDGYGVKIHIDKEVGKSTMVLFANTGSSVNLLDSGDVVLETFTFPMQIRLKDFYFDGEEQWLEDKETPENSGPTAREGIIIFRPPLAESSVFGFRNAAPTLPIELNTIALRTWNPQVAEGSEKMCQIVTFSRVKDFPELTYDNCQ